MTWLVFCHRQQGWGVETLRQSLPDDKDHCQTGVLPCMRDNWHHKNMIHASKSCQFIKNTCWRCVATVLQLCCKRVAIMLQLCCKLKKPCKLQCFMMLMFVAIMLQFCCNSVAILLQLCCNYVCKKNKMFRWNKYLFVCVVLFFVLQLCFSCWLTM